MNTIHSSRFDLNLLRIFHAVYTLGSTTAAARQLGVSQSAISHGLRRLRLVFEDELFVRAGAAIVPTGRADQLFLPVRQMMETLDAEVMPGITFQPGSAQREFSLAMVDMAEMVFLPPLLRCLNRSAPLCTMRSRRLSNEAMLDALESGDVELAIGNIPEADGHIYSRSLFQHDYVVLCWKNHPRLAGKALGWDDFARERHIVVVSGSDQHLVKSALEPRGIRRSVQLTVGGFLAVPWIVRGTELLATVPARLGQDIAQAAGLEVHPLPDPVAPYALQSLWHPRTHNDPGHRWFRQTVFDVMHAYPQLPDTLSA